MGNTLGGVAVDMSHQGSNDPTLATIGRYSTDSGLDANWPKPEPVK
jgi:hypothetical protein